MSVLLAIGFGLATALNISAWRRNKEAAQNLETSKRLAQLVLEYVKKVEQMEICSRFETPEATELRSWLESSK